MPLFVLYIFMSIRTTFFLESANPVAVQLLLQLLLLLWFLLSFLFVVLLLQLPLPLHVMPVVFVLPFFFVLQNADVSSNDFFFRILAEPANITHLQCTSVY